MPGYLFKQLTYSESRVLLSSQVQCLLQEVAGRLCFEVPFWIGSLRFSGIILAPVPVGGCKALMAFTFVDVCQKIVVLFSVGTGYIIFHTWC